MRERVLRVGKSTPLTCIATEPVDFTADDPAVIILNSGLMHHVGTCRLSVKFARALAAKGYYSVRADFSGIGDSLPRRSTLTFIESAPQEVIEIMDYLQKAKGINRFVLYGLCSGADASYATSLIDDRVIGICQIDAYAYRTWKYYLHHYGPQLLHITAWFRFIKNRMSETKSSITGIVPGAIPREHVERVDEAREFPKREVLADGLQQLVNRNIALYNIFTSGQSAIYNYEEQYRESLNMVDFKDQLKVNYYSEASHIIKEPKYQQKMILDIVEWVSTLTPATPHNS